VDKFFNSENNPINITLKFSEISRTIHWW